MDTHTAAVAVVEARSVTAVQSLLTTHVGAQLVRVCVCVCGSVSLAVFGLSGAALCWQATRVVVLGAQHAAGAARWVSPQVMLEAAAESGAEPHR